jgi:hypothetical protein
VTLPFSLKYFKVFKIKMFPTPCIYELLVTLTISGLFSITVPSDFLLMTEISLLKRVKTLSFLLMKDVATAGVMRDRHD